MAMRSNEERARIREAAERAYADDNDITATALAQQAGCSRDTARRWLLEFKGEAAEEPAEDATERPARAPRRARRNEVAQQEPPAEEEPQEPAQERPRILTIREDAGMREAGILDAIKALAKRTRLPEAHIARSALAVGLKAIRAEGGLVLLLAGAEEG